MPSPRPPPSAARGAGARLTDARALDPALVAVPADPAGDAALVERLARWAGRWSPLVEVDGARLACGSTSAESRICSAARRGWSRMSESGFAALGLTTPGGDRADGRGGLGAGAITAAQRRSICGKDTGAKLAPLPVAALRLAARSRRGRSSGWASRPSARWPGCRGGRSRGGSAGPTIRRRCARPGARAASPSR